MESITPPYQLLVKLRSQIEAGASLRSSLLSFTQESDSKFAADLGRWFLQGAELENAIQFKEIQSSPYRKALIGVLSSGLKGQSIRNHLLELEQEFYQASLSEIEEDLKMLPFKMMIPLLLLQVPAFLVLLFGPITRQFLQVVGS